MASSIRDRAAKRIVSLLLVGGLVAWVGVRMHNPTPLRDVAPVVATECQTSAVDVSYFVQFVPGPGSGYKVISSTVNGIDGACSGGSLSVSLTHGATVLGTAGPAAVAGSSKTVSFASPPLASAVDGVTVQLAVESGGGTFTGNFDCSASFPPTGSTITGNLKVPSGVACNLSNVNVGGNVDVKEGGSLVAHGSSIGGNVDAKKTLKVILDQGSSVGGNLKIEESGGVALVGSFGGNVDIKKTGGVLSPRNYVCNSTIGGNFSLSDSSSGSPFSVGGPNSPNPPCTSGNSIKGNAAFQKNAGGLWIANEAVRGNLDCKDNAPAPVLGGTNTAKKKSGQCA